MAKVGIIIPMYNVDKFIEKCLNSCLEQTFKDIEILAIDDESQDLTLQIAKKFEKKDRRVKVYAQKNSGVSVARNLGIKKSTSDWILFLDGDDWLESDAVEKMLEVAEREKPDVLLSNYYTENSKGSFATKFLNSDEFIFISKDEKIELIENCICKTKLSNMNSSTNIGVPWAKLYNRNFLLKNNCNFVIGLKRMQDMIFNINTLFKCNKIIYKDIYTYHYRLQTNSVTKKYTSDFSETASSILYNLKCFIDKNNLYKELLDIYYAKTIKLLLETIKIQYVPSENKISYKKKRKQITKLLKSEPYIKTLKSKNYFGLSKKEIILKKMLDFKMIDAIYLLYKISYYKKRKLLYR